MDKILKKLRLSVTWKCEDGLKATRESFIEIPWMEQYTKDIKESQIINIKVEPVCQ